jgi:hypothetical protein
MTARRPSFLHHEGEAFLMPDRLTAHSTDGVEKLMAETGITPLAISPRSSNMLQPQDLLLLALTKQLVPDANRLNSYSIWTRHLFLIIVSFMAIAPCQTPSKILAMQESASKSIRGRYLVLFNPHLPRIGRASELIPRQSPDENMPSDGAR